MAACAPDVGLETSHGAVAAGTQNARVGTTPEAVAATVLPVTSTTSVAPPEAM